MNKQLILKKNDGFWCTLQPNCYDIQRNWDDAFLIYIFVFVLLR